MAVLAIDVGDKKIGLAVGDQTTRMAFTRPPLLVSSWDDAWPALQKIVIDEHIDTIIVGWPLNTDGSVGPQSARVDEFILELGKRSSVPILKRDERLTSAAVQREQRSAGQKMKRGEEDSLAAQLLAESYLSELS